MADTWFYITCENTSVKVKLADLGDGTFGLSSFSPASSSTHIAGAATTLVKSGAGILRKIIINKAVAAGVVTMYDSLTATGTVLGIITNPAVLLQSQVPIQYDVKFATGLTVVTSAADDLTVAYS